MKKITPEKALNLIETADKRGQEEWRREAYESQLMYAGYQWPEKDIRRMDKEKRPTVVFNRVAVLVDAIIGTELANRKEVKYYPRTQQSDILPDVMNSVAQWVRQSSGQERAEYDAMKDMLLTGIGVTSSRMNYEDSEQGKMKVSRENPLTYRYDPDAVEKNLMDRKWDAINRTMTIDEIQDAFPDVEVEGEEGTNYGDKTKFKKSIRPQQYDEKLNKQGNGKKGLTVWQFEYKFSEKYIKAENVFMQMPEFEFLLPDLVEKFGEQAQQPQMNLTEGGWKALTKIAKGLDLPEPPHAKLVKKVYKKLVFVEETLQILYDGDNAVQRFTRNCITGKRDEKNNTWYGIMRAVKDPQLYANKLFSTILYTYMSNSKGGIIIEDTNIVDHEELRSEWAKPDGITRVNDINKIKERSKGDISTAAAQIMQYSIEAIPAASGVNPEYAAVEQRNRTNALASTRIKQSQALQAEYLDAVSSYRMTWGEMLVQFTKEYLAQEERLIHLIDEDGQKFINLLQAPLADDYDVIIEEGALTVSQRMETWDILSQIFQGQGVPPPLLEFLPLPKQTVQKVQEYFAQQGQPSPEQQALAAAEVEKTKADTAKAYALAENSKARTQKVLSDVEGKDIENTSTRLSMLMGDMTGQGINQYAGI